jgi:hypothetical protein
MPDALGAANNVARSLLDRVSVVNRCFALSTPLVVCLVGTTVSPQADAATSCPLTTRQVSSIFGVRTPKVPDRPTNAITCTFAGTRRGNVDLGKPALTVMPYPGDGQPKDLGDLYDHLAELEPAAEAEAPGTALVAMPSWGKDSFYSIQTTPTLTSVSVFVGSRNVFAMLPKSYRLKTPRSVALGIGRRITRK